MQRDKLIKFVADYSAACGLAETSICQYAIQNRNFINNLRDGKDYRIGTADKLVQWIVRDATERNLLKFKVAAE